MRGAFFAAVGKVGGVNLSAGVVLTNLSACMARTRHRGKQEYQQKISAARSPRPGLHSILRRRRGRTGRDQVPAR
jgi:hypothetical protein